MTSTRCSSPARPGSSTESDAASLDPKPVEIEQEFEIGRPAGTKPGTALDLVVAINIEPLPLEPGRQYAWRLTIDGEGRDDWRLSFAVRSAADGP